MGTSEISQAAAVSRLLNKKGGVVCGPSYGDGSTKTGTSVRAGQDTAVGCSIRVDNNKSAGDDQVYMKRADWVSDALAKAGYRFDREDRPVEEFPLGSHTRFTNVRLMVRPANGKVMTNGHRTRKQPVYAKATGSMVIVDGRDCLDGFGEDGRRVCMEIPRTEGQSEGDALRELARRLCEVAAKRDEYPRAV